MIDLKKLKKLADTCRKAGIKHYKDADMEFTLTDDAPVSEYKRRNNEFIHAPEDPTIMADGGLTEEQIMFYSVSDPTAEGNTQ